MSDQLNNPGISDLFRKIENDFQKTSLSEKWYIAILAALAGGSNPLLCSDLYLYLLSKKEYSTPPQRQALIRRIREVLIKCVSIVGVCKPIEAILEINKYEKEEDKDQSTTREGWQCDEENLNRGMGWMQKIYTGNLNDTMHLFRDHKDFEWISRHITYGLYLSDRQVLDDTETEVAVFSGIMIQNLAKETHWHIRGMRRIGVPKEDVQVVWNSVNFVAEFLGLKLDRVPSVEEIEGDI